MLLVILFITFGTDIPSMAFGRKRVYAGARPSRRPMKKRRVNRRRKTGGRKSMAMTSKSGVGGIIRFSSKKVSRQRWNNLLWTSTLQKAHYRTIGSATGTFASANSSGLIRWYSNVAIPNDFYTVASGAQPLDAGVAVPTFRDDIILRGGQVGIRFANQAADVLPMHIYCYLVRTVNLSNVSTRFPAGGADQTIGSDPTTFPDFSVTTGRVIASKSFLLENSTVGEFVTKIRIAKHDQEALLQDKGSLYWVFGVGNCESATQPNVTKTNWWNASFSGDAA